MKTPHDKPTPEEHLILWVMESIKQIDYGKVTLTLHIHQGKIIGSEKNIVLEEKYSVK